MRVTTDHQPLTSQEDFPPSSLQVQGGLLLPQGPQAINKNVKTMVEFHLKFFLLLLTKITRFVKGSAV